MSHAALRGVFRGRQVIRVVIFWNRMELARKIDNAWGKIFISLLFHVTILGFFIKIYNIFIYLPSYYDGSWSNYWSDLWKSPIFNSEIFKDYWSNPFHITLYTFLIIPPVLAYIATWWSGRVCEKENRLELEKEIEEAVQQAQQSKNKPPEPKFKGRKKKNKKKI